MSLEQFAEYSTPMLSLASLLSGGIIGSVTRVTQYAASKSSENKAPAWLPGGAVAVASVMGASTHQEPLGYGLFIASSLIGDYLTTRLVDKSLR